MTKSKENIPANKDSEVQKNKLDINKRKKQIIEKLKNALTRISQESIDLTKPFAFDSSEVTLRKEVKTFLGNFYKKLDEKLDEAMKGVPKTVKAKLKKQINVKEILKNLSEKSVITITGIASMEGSFNYNKDLAKRRADATKSALLSSNPGIEKLFNIETKGVVYGPELKPITNIQKAKQELVRKWNKEVAGDDRSQRVISVRQIYRRIKNPKSKKESDFNKKYFADVRKAAVKIRIATPDEINKEPELKGAENSKVNSKPEKAEREPKGKAKAKALFKKAKNKVRTKDFEGAIKIYKEAYSHFSYPVILYNLALCYLAIGDRKKAKKHIKRYLSKTKKNIQDLPKPLVNLVKGAENSKVNSKPEKAEREPKGKAKAKALVKKGIEEFDGGRHTKAIDLFKEAYSHYPSPKIHTRIAVCYKWLGDFKKALYHYKFYIRKVNELDLASKEKILVKTVLSEIKKLEKKLANSPQRSKEKADWWKKYDYVSSFDYGRARVKKDGKWGIVDKKGNEVVEPKYDYVGIFQKNGRARVKKGDKYFFINKNGEVVSKKYDYIGRYYEGLARVRKGDKYFFINKNEEVVSKKYDYIGLYIEGLARVRKGDKYFFINKNEEVVSKKYDYIGLYYEGLARVKKGDKYFFINKNEEVVSKKYDYIGLYYEGLARVKKGDKYFFINKNEEVVSKKYDYIGLYYEGLARVEKDGKWGFVDKSGNEVVKLKYDKVWDFQKNGRAAVKKDGKRGFVDKKGNEVVEPKYDKVWDFENGKALVVDENGEQFYIDINGEKLQTLLESLNEKYDKVRVLYNGRRAVKKGKKWGFVDESGKEVIEPKYDEVQGFIKHGVAQVKKDRKWGFVDKSGKEIVEPKYDAVWGFMPEYEIVFGSDHGFEYNDRALVKKDRKWGIVDKSGKEIVEPKYDAVHMSIPIFREGLARVKKDGKWGFVDKKGNEYNLSGQEIKKSKKAKIEKKEADWKSKFDWVDDFHEGLARAVKGQKTGFVDRNGKVVVPIKYEDASIFKNGIASVKKKGKWIKVTRGGTEITIPRIQI
jgi:tetratricopeptide (TPR) repeat protein